MNIGAVLIGLGAGILLATYVARPFRRQDVDVDAQVEAWIASMRESLGTESGSAPGPYVGTPVGVNSASSVTAEPPSGVARFCHQCGRPVKPHHRFCPQCGANLSED